MNPKNKYSIYRIVLSTLGALILIALVYFFLDLFTLLAISILISMIFNPIVDFLEGHRVPRLYSVLGVFIITAVLFGTLLSFLLPKLISQLSSVSQNLNEATIKSSIGQIEQAIKSRFPFLSSINLTEKATTLINQIVLGWINNLSGVIQSLFSLIAGLVIVPFMTFFIIKDNKKLKHGIINLVPNRYFEFCNQILTKIIFQLSRYVRGWILDAFLVGLFITIGLSILGIENSISIGFVAGVGHLIPYFGPLIGGIPAIIISILQFGDLTMLPAVIILFTVIYTFDNGFIQPNIFSKSTDMHPLAIILLILIGSQLMGVLGMLLAVPAATILKTAAKEIYLGYKNYKVLRL